MNSQRWCTLILALSLLITPIHGTQAQARPVGYDTDTSVAILYVDRSATGSNQGTSWANAFTNLQSALDGASAGDQIWVAQGVYTPTNTIGRTATFSLKAGVSLYGGFDPASGVDVWSERDWQAHVTALSGDLDGNDIPDANGVITRTNNIIGNNAYHVLSSSNLTETARLDGFYVTGGKADGVTMDNRLGGGMFNRPASRPSLVNVTFSGNLARNYSQW